MANVVVYCNLDRYTRTNRPDGAFYDPDSNSYQAVSDPMFRSCKTGVAISGTRKPLALTNNYRGLQKVASEGVCEAVKSRLTKSHTTMISAIGALPFPSTPLLICIWF